MKATVILVMPAYKASPREQKVPAYSPGLVKHNYYQAKAI
jgi:hypothetical protein